MKKFYNLRPCLLFVISFYLRTHIQFTFAHSVSKKIWGRHLFSLKATSCYVWLFAFGPGQEKTSLRGMQTTKVQTSLHIRQSDQPLCCSLSGN